MGTDPTGMFDDNGLADALAKQQLDESGVMTYRESAKLDQNQAVAVAAGMVIVGTQGLAAEATGGAVTGSAVTSGQIAGAAVGAGTSAAEGTGPIKGIKNTLIGAAAGGLTAFTKAGKFVQTAIAGTASSAVVQKLTKGVVNASQAVVSGAIAGAAITVATMCVGISFTMGVTAGPVESAVTPIIQSAVNSFLELLGVPKKTPTVQNPDDQTQQNPGKRLNHD